MGRSPKPQTSKRGRIGRRDFLVGSAAAGMGGALQSRLYAGPAVLQEGDEEFDYVIVGAGSSGCVVANRLTEDSGTRVLLLEAGGPDSNPAIQDPGRWPTLLGGEFDWQYVSESEPHLDGRTVGWPRGKCLGGCSSINALLYVRGHRLDFDHWNYLGNAGWSWEEVLPYFKKSEDQERGASSHHAVGGLLRVADTPDPPDDRMKFIEAALELGYEGSPDWDFNGPRQENGAGIYQRNIKDGKRHSAAAAFLTPFLGRSNLSVKTRARVVRILWDGRRAAGLEYRHQGEVRRARARREVVLSAGVVDSPRLLMLSGVGPADRLRGLGIGVIADLPGVGSNLQDHLRASVRFEARRQLPASMCTAGLFTRSRSGLAAASPDLQFYLGTRPLVSEELSLTVCHARPLSTGSVTLRSADPEDPPVIRGGYLESPGDVEVLAEGIRIARALANRRAFDDLRGEERDPGRGVTTAREIEAYLRSTATSIFHGVGTCSMGGGRMAVVDSRLLVRGVEGLRVVDASVMPAIVNGNTHAACVMIGEKASDMIRESQGDEG